MFIGEAISDAQKALQNSLEVELLLAFSLKKSREYIFAHPEEELSATTISQFCDLCTRRTQGIPIAYLTNHKEFFGLDFYVDERVFIPRPETEWLIEEVVREVSRRKQQEVRIQICDIGTGSGCIAIALAKNIPNAHITALDISEKAFEVAKKNIAFHGLKSQVELIQSDLLSEVSTRKFHGIIANLPYIGTSENHLVEKEVREHEPPEALFGGETGLELFEKLFSQIQKMKFLPRWLIAEMGFLQRRGLSALIKKYFGEKEIVWKNDLAGLPRYFILYV